jgi:hypothetical protein
MQSAHYILGAADAQYCPRIEARSCAPSAAGAGFSPGVRNKALRRKPHWQQLRLLSARILNS